MLRVTALVLVAALAPHALAQNFKMPPTYGTVTLRGGENSIPTVIKVEAGGNINTNLGGVAAWVANPPDVRLNYTAGRTALVFKAESELDTTLLINLPDGTWIANDDGPNMGLNPYIKIDAPKNGQYDIWVGSFQKGKFPPAMLSIADAAMGMEMSKAPMKDMKGSMPSPKKTGSYAVVEIENRLSKNPVRYQFRWGEQGQWGKQIVLKPGRNQTHSFAMQPGGQAPLPQIVFEKGIGVDAGTITYNLEYYPSVTESGGRGYNFAQKTGSDTREYVELFKRTKSQEDAAYKLSTAIMKTLSGDYKGAEYQASKAIEVDPTCTRAYAIRGRARQFGGDFDGALRDFAKGQRLAPSDSELVVFRAEAFGRKKRIDRAIEEATKALEMDPFSVAALSERAAAYYAMRNYDAAIADCQKAIKLDAKGWIALTTLGESYIAKGQPIQAIDALSQALAIQRNDFEPFAARAQAYKAVGDSFKSANDYREAMRLRMPPGYAVHYPDAEAFRDLDNYPLGQFLTPDILKKFNLQAFEVEPPYPGKAPATMAKEVDELVAGEWARHRAYKFESAAGVDRFLRAALLTDAERKGQGMELDWYYGPVTSPVARFRSGDDLGGLRIIGNLKLPGKQEITMIFALTYDPPKGEKTDNGKVGLLFDGDNARLQMRLHSKGALETDYFFAGFGANAQSGKMIMRAAYNLDETTGSLIHESLTPASLSTRCIHCHNKGFEPSEKLVEQLQIYRTKATDEIAKLAPIRKFLELAEINGASRTEIRQLEKQMIDRGPSALIPLQDLYEANRKYWLEIYPQFVDMRRDPRRYLENAALIAPPREQHNEGAEMKNMPAMKTKGHD